MKVIITAGGTGGHIYPALAVIDKIKEMEPDSEFLYIGTHNRMEHDLIPERGIPYMPIEIYGLSTDLKLMGRNIKNVFLIKKAYKKCLEIIKSFKPDVVLGFGGYVTYPVIKAAKKCGVKTFVHEQNSIPGKANKSLMKYTDLVGISFKDSEKYFTDTKVVYTGNPCAENAIKKDKISKTIYGLHEGKKGVLIFNGSLGSSSVNEKMIDFLKSVEKENYEILYVTGKNSYESFSKNTFPSNVYVKDYIDNLSSLMKDMDLIVCRAGASSVAEIEALCIPSILIPSPFVANNHQYFNALSIVEANAASMIEEKDLSAESIRNGINKILYNEDIIMEYKINLKKLNVNNPATVIYDELKKLIDK